MVLQNADTGATSVGGVGVPFDAESISDISELPSIVVGLLLLAHPVLDPCLVVGVFVVLEKRVFRWGRVFNFHMPDNYSRFDCLWGSGVCRWTNLERASSDYYQKPC